MYLTRDPAKLNHTRKTGPEGASAGPDLRAGEQSRLWEEVSVACCLAKGLMSLVSRKYINNQESMGAKWYNNGQQHYTLCSLFGFSDSAGSAAVPAVSSQNPNRHANYKVTYTRMSVIR